MPKKSGPISSFIYTTLENFRNSFELIRENFPVR